MITDMEKITDKPRAIILRTAGTNCSYETTYALEKAGADVDLIHVNQLMKEKSLLDSYHIFCFTWRVYIRGRYRCRKGFGKPAQTPFAK